MNPFAEFRKSRFSILQVFLACLLVLLLVVFVVVILSENPRWIFKLLGISGGGEPWVSEGKLKYEALKFVGISMGGVLVALQALIANKRANALEHTARAQADAAKAQAGATKEQAEANQNAEQGQRQERLKNAIEHLGHTSDSVRLAGAYELFHLARDTEELRQTVFDILCAHIRWTTGENKYREKHKSKPSEEIQSLLTLLFVQEHEVFTDLSINLQGSWLNGAELFGADLQGANFMEAHLQGAAFSEAYLQEALFVHARMQGAYLVRARLDGAYLYKAQLQGANLGVAWLRGAELLDSQLQGVNLAEVQLQGAILVGVQLQGAHFFETHLHGVRCEEDISDSFAQRMRQSIGWNSDLSRVIFAGGLSKDDVDSLVSDLSGEEVNELREKLTPHIGKKESNRLPKNSGAITGVYAAEEAERWVAEYEGVMSKVPEEDS